MKKVFFPAFAVLLVVAISFTMTACKKIEGDRWNATKSRWVATCTNEAVKEKDGIYSVTLSITYTVSVFEDKKVEVNKSDFKLSQEVVSWIMHGDLLNNVHHTDKEVVTISGSGSGTTLNYVKLEIDFGDGITYKELDKLRKKFSITYKGVKIKLGKTVQYKDLVVPEQQQD